MGIRAVAVLVDLRATGINMDRDVDRDVDMDAAAATDAAAAFIVNEFSKTKSQLQDSRRHALEWNGMERNEMERNEMERKKWFLRNRTEPSQANKPSQYTSQYNAARGNQPKPNLARRIVQERE